MRKPGRLCDNWRVASIPPILGMLRSISRMSGRNSIAFVMASPPSAASPTTVISEKAASKARRPPRMTPWSSAISIRIGIRYLHNQSSSNLRCTFHQQLSAQYLRPFLHPDQSQSTGFAGFLQVHPHPIVFDHNDDFVILPFEDYIHIGSMGMPNDIRNRFLYDTINGRLHLLGKRRILSRTNRLEMCGYTVALACQLNQA